MIEMCKIVTGNCDIMWQNKLA